MTAIQAKTVTKRYGKDVVAVQSLDLTVEEGEIFGFLGPNGAGKSTTINMILDFIRPSDGTIEVLGMDAQEKPLEIRRRVGVVPEGYAFNDPLTGREFLEWAIESKNANDNPDEILAEVGIKEDADRQASDFSKGMQQRLALGIALVGDPELLILDEPSSGLDPNGVQKMRQILRERAEDGTTVFFSSHILAEVEAVCDRVGILNEGELVALDTIDALQEDVDAHSEVRLECSTAVDSGDIDSVEGVEDVAVDGQTLTIHCSTPKAKADAIASVYERAEIVDVAVEDTSLEQLFNEYTQGGRDVDGTDPSRTDSEELAA